MKTTKEFSKKNSGITLIALIITIIVMLILVAVTVTMAVNGGLFEQAGNAGRQTNKKVQEELEFATGMTLQELIDKYASTTGAGTDFEEEDNQGAGEYEDEESCSVCGGSIWDHKSCYLGVCSLTGEEFLIIEDEIDYIGATLRCERLWNNYYRGWYR